MVNPNIEAFKRWLEEHSRQKGDPWNVYEEIKKKGALFVGLAVVLLLTSRRN